MTQSIERSISCGSCGEQCASFYTYCLKCGARLRPTGSVAIPAVTLCPECGRQHALNKFFCATCGHSLEKPKSVAAQTRPRRSLNWIFTAAAMVLLYQIGSYATKQLHHTPPPTPTVSKGLIVKTEPMSQISVSQDNRHFVVSRCPPTGEAKFEELEPGMYDVQVDYASGGSAKNVAHIAKEKATVVELGMK